MGIGIEFNKQEEMIRIIDLINSNGASFKYNDNYLYIAYITSLSICKNEDYKITINDLTFYIKSEDVDYLGVL